MLTILIFNSQRVIENYLVIQAQQHVTTLKESFNSSLSRLLVTRDYASIRSLMEQWLHNKNIAYMCILQDGKELISMGIEHHEHLPPHHDEIDLSEKLFHAVMPIIYEEQSFGTLQFGVRTDFLVQAKKDLLNQSTLIAMIEITLSAFILFGIGLFLTRNLVRLLEASQKVAQGDYDINLPNKGKDELALLAHSFTDMTGEIKQKIEELHQVNSHLQELVDAEVKKVQAKDAIIHEQSRQAALSTLLVNIAHQWRQPLNSISIEASMISDIMESEQGNPEKIEKSLDRILDQAQDLSAIISHFTKLYEQKDETCHVSHAVLAAQKLLEEQCLTQGVTIHLSECDHEVRGDAKILSEIFVALLQNSLDAFNERGSQGVIHISCHASEEEVCITLEDTAGGIKPELLSLIFDPYSTSHFQSRNKGLGLYLVNNLVKFALGGSIHAENSSQGARFTIQLERINVSLNETADSL